MKFMTTIILTFNLFTLDLYADAHKHGVRTHDHPLPTQGVKHRHGNGAYGVPANKQTGSITNPRHTRASGKTIDIYGVHVPLNSKYIMRDQKNCIHYNPNPIEDSNTKETLQWTGECRDGFAYGFGKWLWFKNGVKDKRGYYSGLVDPRLQLHDKYVKLNKKRNKDIAKKMFDKKLEASNKINKWSSINKGEAYKLISGKTLVSEHKAFCSKGDTSSSCKKIAILSPSHKMSAGGKNPATIILPTEKEIIKSHWGLYATDWLYLDLDMGIIPVPVNNNKFSFESVVSINKNRNALRIITPDKKVLEINIITGKNNHYLAQAKKGNYSEFDNTGRKTAGQAIAGSIMKGIGNSMTSPRNNSNTYNSSNNDTSNNVQKSTTRKAHVTGIKERKLWTIVKCSKGKDTKVHHNSDRSCTDDYSFGSYPCPHVIKKAVKRCESR